MAETTGDGSSSREMNKGVAKTSLFVAACRALITNKLLGILEKEEGAVDNEIQVYAREVSKEHPEIYQKGLESEMLKPVNSKEVMCFDPYAYYFVVNGEFTRELMVDTYTRLLNPKEEDLNKFKMFISKVNEIVAWNRMLNHPLLFRMVLRTKYIDNILMENTPAISQVVILGTGMDCRPLRLPLPESTHVYELDFPHVIAYKQEFLDKCPIKKHLSKAQINRLPCDLSEQSWGDNLLKSGFRSDLPSIWIMEGLLMYIEQEKIKLLFQEINRITCPGSKILTHTITNDIDNMKGVAGDLLAKIFVSRNDHPLQELFDPIHYTKDQSSKTYSEMAEELKVENPPETVKSDTTKYSIATKE